MSARVVARIVTAPATWDVVITDPRYWGRNHDSGRYEYTHFVITNTRLAPPREFLDEPLEEEGCWERLGSWPDVIAEGTQVGVRLTAAATEREQRESQNLEKLRSVVALRQFGLLFAAQKEVDNCGSSIGGAACPGDRWHQGHRPGDRGSTGR